MTRTHRFLLPGILSVLAALCLGWLLGRLWPKTAAPAPASSSPGAPETASSNAATPSNVTAGISRLSTDDLAPTLVYAHNLQLRKGPDFRVYVIWISGQLMRTQKLENPSFDDPDSFVLEIKKGVIHANIGDISNYLNSSSPANAPLKNISIKPDGDQLKLHGIVHKIIPLPVEVTGTLAATPDGRVRFHVTKLAVLKLPLKGLLGSFHLGLSDLMHASDLPGVEISGNDIFFDTEKLLPPPHIHGQLTTVRVQVPDIEVIYGNAPNDASTLAQWHNFLRFRNGAIDFGKLTMHHVDLTMIDATQEPWFDLDLVNYQAQVVNGYTRMTSQAGLEIFMPSLKERAPKQAGRDITLEWLKNRNTSLPADVKVKK